MSDDSIIKSDVDAASVNEIDRAVQAVLEAKGVIFPTIENWSAMAMPGRDTVTPIRTTVLTAGDKSEQTDVDTQALTLSADAISLNKHKAAVARIEDFAKLQALPNMEALIAERLSSAFVQVVEADLVTALVATSSSAPDHQIAFDSGTTLQEADILEAIELLDVQNVPDDGRYLLVPPSQYVDLLAIARFTEADKLGAPGAIRNGVVGMIHGLTVIKSTKMTANKCVVYHSSHVGIAIQQGMALMRQRADMASFAEDFGGQMVYGVKTFDSGKRGVLIG